ncbi:MAG: hypothetical protein UD936_10845 [Acutalibacteraceae bacterium]|nr:hypothetical protein [Acutalibacteraceae bacterium]
MPQISKIRIVNFKYNDGKRLIADELYDFSDIEQNNAMNVLVNLANGGGKSVLVQLMLQPLVPRAKVAGRSIESFFSKSGDHCFVLLEWLKDNSTEKLLTGIAMSAKDNTLAEDDSERGRSVKYYTFYSNYIEYNSQYDIINMPLSKKENGVFVPASFDSVRKLARKSNGFLNHYASEDTPRWRKKIAEYGLSFDEWKMIAELNSEEGGLSKFFGSFKTSDNLIDELLIKTIERKLTQIQTKEDNSLVTMLRSYAEQYVSKQSEIENKEVYELFVQSLSELMPKVTNLCDSDYLLKDCTGNLFGLLNALNIRLDECKKSQDKCKEETESLQEQVIGIKHEKVSAEYYCASDEFEEAESCYNATEEKLNHIKEQLKDKNYAKTVLECAGYYKSLADVKRQIEIIQNQIADKESGADVGDELANLKYSVFVKVCDLLEKYIPEYGELNAEKSELSAKKQAEEKVHKAAKAEHKKAETESIRAESNLQNAKQETDNEMAQLGVEITRKWFDGTYEESELLAFKTNKELERDELIAEKEKAIREQNEIEEQIAGIPQKLADLSIKRTRCASEKESVEERLSEYSIKENQVKNICAEYNLDFSMRFTSYICETLESEQSNAMAKLTELERKIQISKEEINSANKGYLHVPYSVIEYLNSTGVRYSTCEKYLTDQISEGKITNEECLELLKSYPAVAYGVLMEPKEKERFFTFEREKWLPAMIPLFTYEQMAEILKNISKSDEAIAFYSEEYFADKAMYIELLKKRQSDLYNEQSLCKAIEKDLKKYIDIAKAFDYSENWESQQKEILCGLEEAIRQIDEEKLALEKQKSSLQAKKNSIVNQIKAVEDNIREAQLVLKGIDRIKNRIAKEAELSALLQKAIDYEATAKQSLSSAETRLELLITEIEETDRRHKELKTTIDKLETIKINIGKCSEAELIDGDYEELYDRYQTMQDVLNRELSELKYRLEAENRSRSVFQKLLDDRELELSEYENVIYSVEQLDNIKLSVKQLSAEQENITAEFNRCSEARGRACQQLQTAEKALSNFGAPLEKSQIGTGFDKRIDELNQRIISIYAQKDKLAKKESSVNATLERLKDQIRELTCPEAVPAIKLEESEKEQFENLIKEYNTAKSRFTDLHKAVYSTLQKIKDEFRDTSYVVCQAVESLQSLILSDKRGNRYFTLAEHIEIAIENSKREISRIMTNLKDFESSYDDLVRQCTLQGERIYDGLLQMASSSRVTIYEGKGKKQMIRFDIPAEVDPIVAKASIADEIDKGTKELVEMLLDQSFTDSDKTKMAERIVGSKNLLRKYIGKDSIRVEAYKIDQNPQNAGYRTWEETQVNNSGAEKFVVYFAVILSLMNYTRGDVGDIRDKDLCSALILDNPFGATSSKHILLPMFAIAKHFRVQLICLSDINKSDVVNCFDIVIKAIVKKQLMSNNELLTHEGNEVIEHGYYRAEQITLF